MCNFGGKLCEVKQHSKISIFMLLMLNWNCQVKQHVSAELIVWYWEIKMKYWRNVVGINSNNSELLTYRYIKETYY